MKTNSNQIRQQRTRDNDMSDTMWQQCPKYGKQHYTVELQILSRIAQIGQN